MKGLPVASAPSSVKVVKDEKSDKSYLRVVESNESSLMAISAWICIYCLLFYPTLGFPAAATAAAGAAAAAAAAGALALYRILT